MKPIFKEEVKMLKENFGILIPENSWKKKGGWVLIPNKNGDLVNIGRLGSEFGGTIYFKPSKRKIPNNVMTHKEFCLMKSNYKEKIKDMTFLKGKNIKISTSTGKDSEVSRFVVEELFGEKFKFFTNTSLDLAPTLKLAKQSCDLILNPKEGFYTWIQKDNQLIPSRAVRKCCDIFKEGQLESNFDNIEEIYFICGLRKSESKTRESYTLTMKNTNWSKNAIENWTMVNPIIDFEEIDVWACIFENNLTINPLYKMGYTRVGCGIACPYQQSYINALDKIYFKPQYDRWNKIKKKKFIEKNLWVVLNCTIEEYLWDGWKKGMKYRKEPTKEVVEEFAKYKNMSIEMSKKFFITECRNGCTFKIRGKEYKRTLQNDEIALNMKFNGTFVKEFYCISCLAKLLGTTVKDLKNRAKEFKEAGCKLF